METNSGIDKMGRISQEIILSNHSDVMRAENGELPVERIRRVSLKGTVDTGASHLVIPGWAQRELGIALEGEAVVRYANNQTATRPIARYVQLAVAGREGVFRAIVEPDRQDALIGAIVLEDMDLLADCNRQRLVPRDPEHFMAELE